MTGNYEKTLQQLEQADAKLQRAIEKKKELEARKKMLLERSEIERLCSRGTILGARIKIVQNKVRYSVGYALYYIRQGGTHNVQTNQAA